MTISPSPPPVIRERYQLVSWLGEGSMGVVYKAHDLRLDRDVAVKFLSPKYFTGAQSAARFLREARLVARLSHPNIMSIFDVGEDRGWQYIVFEYIPGQDLHNLMSQRTDPWPVENVMSILKATLEALAYAHAQGVIHRDIKPENIMLTPQGQVKVTDFGLAFAHEEIRLTQDEGLLGTILYMSPEMIQGQEFDLRTDLYSLGVVFYEILAGEPPFIGGPLLQTISRIIHTDPKPLRLWRPEIPLQLESVLHCLLSKEPQQRYVSADDALRSLTVGSQSVLQEIPPETAVPFSQDAQTVDLPIELTPEALEQPPLSQALFLYAITEDVIDALERERRRMAGLLKNEVMEPLNLLLSQAIIYEKTLSSNQMAHMAVSVLSTLARQVLQQVRDLDQSLQPMTLEGLGLEAALENLANQIRRTRGIQVSLELARLKERFSPRLELALFRMFQDYVAAIQSIGASRIDLTLKQRKDGLEFEIANDASNVLESQALAVSREWLEQLGCTWQAAPDRNYISIRVAQAKPIDLTPRELDVIRLVAEGLSNKEIAQQLAISPRTVNFHLDNLFAKLGVRSRTEAAILALQQGWIERKGRPV